MEEGEFRMPSPKRQRTDSPQPIAEKSLEGTNISSHAKTMQDTATNKSGNDMLDILMQHVESETAPRLAQSTTTSSIDPTSAKPFDGEQSQLETNRNSQQVSQGSGNIRTGASEQHMPTDVKAVTLEKHNDNVIANAITSSERDATVDGALTDDLMRDITNEATTDRVLTSSEVTATMDGIPPVTDERILETTGEPEWEIDSSPYQSSSEESDSSDDTSSEDSDEDDEDMDGDYAMLDPEEQARILMHGDAGSDDEGGRNRSEGAGYKTTNEQLEDVPQIPEITVTTDMPIEELGSIEAVVENNVLIRAKVSGEYQVLEAGSLLCLEDRKVAGVVAETLGRVEQPLYTMRFRTEEDINKRDLQNGKTLYYVVAHSSFVFTQPLKAVKGSDASNIHDEEVGDDEVEFSDDEAEAEHKRMLKLKRQGRQGDNARARGSTRGRGGRGAREHAGFRGDSRDTAYGNNSIEMNYDDVQESEGGYTPLSRPTNLHEMMNGMQGASGTTTQMPPPFSDRGRGRGRGGRGGRDRGRGGYHQQRQQQSPQQTPSVGSYQNTGYSLPFPPPPPPMLTPQSHTYPGSFMTSPISPLPQQQYTFNSTLPNPQFHGHPQHPPAPNPFFNPAAMQQLVAQNHASSNSGAWLTNQAAVAEVQRQLEEMRKLAAQNGQYSSQQ